MASTSEQGLWGGYYENGRLYHSFSKGKYLMPCDEDEQDRLDIYHKFLYIARKYVLHEAPISIPLTQSISASTTGPMILDLGTGTGIWAIEIAELAIKIKHSQIVWQRYSKYFTAHGKVYGIDLAWTQPPNIPANVTFLQRDIDLPWHGLGEDRWDLIHIRLLNGGVSDWRNIYNKCYRHLKPGIGWLEHTEIDLIPRCDDGSLPKDSALNYWTRLVIEATEEAGRSMSYNSSTGLMIEQSGLVDIHEQVIQAPLNTWPADPYFKELGRWYNLGLTQGLQALALAPLTRIKGWSVDDVNKLCNDVRKEISSRHYHVYHNIHVFRARRPNA